MTDENYAVRNLRFHVLIAQHTNMNIMQFQNPASKFQVPVMKQFLLFLFYILKHSTI